MTKEQTYSAQKQAHLHTCTVCCYTFNNCHSMKMHDTQQYEPPWLSLPTSNCISAQLYLSRLPHLNWSSSLTHQALAWHTSAHWSTVYVRTNRNSTHIHPMLNNTVCIHVGSHFRGMQLVAKQKLPGPIKAKLWPAADTRVWLDTTTGWECFPTTSLLICWIDLQCLLLSHGETACEVYERLSGKEKLTKDCGHEEVQV